MSRKERLSLLLAQVERRHWAGLGASLALHVAVFLGLRQETPPEPQPVSFEITLEAPKPEQVAKARVKSKPTASKSKAKIKAKKLAAKRKPAKREPHTLEADWRKEARPDKQAPSVALPEASVFGPDVPVAQTAQPGKAAKPATRAGAAPGEPQAAPTATAAATQPAPARPGAGPAQAEAPASADLSEPGGAGAAAAGNAGPEGDPGIALTASSSLNPNAAMAPGQTPGAMAADSAAGLAASGNASNAGQGPGSLSASQGTGAGRNLAAGNGAQSSSSLEAATSGGGEPQGVRLAVSSTLSERANLPAGAGGLAAGPVSSESGRATPSQSQGSGAALATSRAGGASATPLADKGRPAGGGPAGSVAQRALGQAGQPGAAGGGGKLAHAGSAGKAAANPQRQTGKSAGGAASERAASQGDASGPGKAMLASVGTLGMGGGGKSVNLGVKAAGKGPGASQSGKTLALAPGEPGSSPGLAVAMRPLVATPGVGYGGRRGGGKSAASETGSLGMGAYPGASVASGGGKPGEVGGATGLATSGTGGGAYVRPGGAPAGTPAGGAMSRAGASGAGPAGGTGREPTRLQAVKLAETQVIRPDSQAKPLDVLAPSTYCPLPLPGHSFPDNRPPKPDEHVTTQPAYAPDNPSFVFPVQAWIGSIQGTAVVRVEVLADGRPGRMWLKQSSGSGILDRDAQSQLTLWRFIPARKNGQPVTAWIDVPVVYRLQDAKK